MLFNTLLETTNHGPIVLVIALLVLLVVVLISCIKIVPQATAHVIEFLGSYKTTWHTGMHFKIPFVEKIAKKIICAKIYL